ncbi:MAG: autotransporter-associated beta strand repeat-containing protein [Kiritimatiellales bacterium]
MLFNQSGSITHNDGDNLFYSLFLGSSGLTVTTGTVSIGSTTAIGKVNIALAAAQSWTNNSAGTLTIQNTVSNGAHLLTIGGTGNTLINGTIGNGSGGITKTGAGTLTLAGTNTYSGATTISDGTLQVGNGGTTGTLGTGNVTNNSKLIINRSNAITVSNLISGTGSLTKSGTNTLTLSGANTYSGETKISAGALMVSNTLALQSSTLNYTNNGGAIRFSSGITDYTLGGLAGDKNLALTNAGGTAVALTVGNNASNTTYGGELSAGGSLVKTGAGTLTLTGTNSYSGATTISGGTLQVGSGGTSGTLGAGNVTNNSRLAFNRSDDITVNNRISGSGTLTKSGTNTLTLTAASTYTNTTFVSSGRMVVNGSLQSHMITVAAGATLGGTGTVQAVTLDPGAFLAAGGDGQGTLTFTGEMILSGGSTNFMGILSESLYDVVKGTGANSFTAAGSFVFDFTGNTTVTNGSTFAVLQNWNSIALSGATFSTKGLDAALSVDASKLASDGIIKVIPEPTAISLIGLGGLLTLLSSRLRRRR